MSDKCKTYSSAKNATAGNSAENYSTAWLQHWAALEHTESFQRTLDNIAKSGWEAMSVTGDPRSRFAYTVGAYDVFQIPEFIVVGLTQQTGHSALARAIELLRSGVDVTKGRHRNIVGEIEVEFRPVASAWIKHVMCRADWYYNGANIPALQIVYPDLDGKFQWEENFEEYFHQPLLQSASPQDPAAIDFWSHNDPKSSLFHWKFSDPPHTQVYLSQAVQDRREAITYVSHDEEDGAWQFLGDSMSDGDGPVISCFHHPVDWDSSLVELCDLPIGWYAVRDTPEAPWERHRKHAEGEQPPAPLLH